MWLSLTQRLDWSLWELRVGQEVVKVGVRGHQVSF